MVDTQEIAAEGMAEKRKQPFLIRSDKKVAGVKSDFRGEAAVLTRVNGLINFQSILDLRDTLLV
jgi:hypothetical protein